MQVNLSFIVRSTFSHLLLYFYEYVRNIAKNIDSNPSVTLRKSHQQQGFQYSQSSLREVQHPLLKVQKRDN